MHKKKKMENPGIDPGTSRMQSGRSTIWANSPVGEYKSQKMPISSYTFI